MNNLSNREFWNNSWERENRENFQDFIFKDLLDKYIKSSGKRFLEIGCAPGSIMTYFYKVHGCDVYGVDYADLFNTEMYLQKNKVKKYKIYNLDFTDFSVEEKFDIVASFGFVEHFQDYHKIIQKHKELVGEKGLLIIEVPNLRYFNGLIYRILKPKLFKMHNRRIMNPAILKIEVMKSYDFNIIYCDYYKTSMFQFNENNAELESIPFMKTVFKFIKSIFEKTKTSNIPNRWFSPYLILIAQRIR